MGGCHLQISLDHIRKADVVAQTKIVYKEKELLQLIHDHLVQNGLEQSAVALQREAGLSTRHPIPPNSSQFYDSPTPSRHKQTVGRALLLS